MDQTLNHFKGKVAIVTGASAGIGEAIVESLVKRGLQVVGLARRKNRLDEISKRLQHTDGKFFPLQADISKEKDIVEAFMWTKANVGPVHVLINNAGIARNNGLTDGDPQTWRDIFNTNVLGLCIATKLAVNQMIQSNISGHIVHINSVAGHKIPAHPNLNVYPASKWAVTALTETLRQELNRLGSKIKITSISPGAVRTEIAVAAGIVPENSDVDIFDCIPSLTSEDIADSVVYVLSTPPNVQVHDLIIKPIGEVL